MDGEVVTREIIMRWACGCWASQDADTAGHGTGLLFVRQTDACDQNPSICDEQSGRPPVSVTEE